ncbi:hypothetical protein K438DRAFT_1855247 [Mycena galopus ATCC 62051]|nr:hypothetical protein K438DRAFT_1855247 [Mycena galopus ATCC 62051]
MPPCLLWIVLFHNFTVQLNSGAANCSNRAASGSSQLFLHQLGGRRRAVSNLEITPQAPNERTSACLTFTAVIPMRFILGIHARLGLDSIHSRGGPAVSRR